MFESLKEIIGRYFLADVFRNQIKTFRNYQTDKVSKIGLSIHFLIPFIIAYLAIHYIPLNNLENIDLITVYSIFIGLLFNLLVLIYGLFRKPSLSIAEKTTVENLCFNIIFTIFISILSIILLILNKILKDKILSFDILEITYHFNQTKILSFLIYYFVIVFILDLLQILKRFTTLLQVDIKKHLGNSKKP